VEDKSAGIRIRGAAQMQVILQFQGAVTAKTQSGIVANKLCVLAAGVQVWLMRMIAGI
jgi:hypothetical protein